MKEAAKWESVLPLDRQRNPRLSPLNAALAAVLCLLVLLCGTLATSEIGHRWVHTQTAHESEAGCAIDLFASGGVAATAVPVLIVVAFVGVLLAIVLPVSAELPSVDARACPTRGPPTLS